MVADIDLSKATSVATEVGGHAVELDVAKREDVEQVVARAEAEVGPIDVLVNNAESACRRAPPKKSTWRTGTRSSMWMSRACGTAR